MAKIEHQGSETITSDLLTFRELYFHFTFDLLSIIDFQLTDTLSSPKLCLAHDNYVLYLLYLNKLINYFKI